MIRDTRCTRSAIYHILFSQNEKHPLKCRNIHWVVQETSLFPIAFFWKVFEAGPKLSSSLYLSYFESDFRRTWTIRTRGTNLVSNFDHEGSRITWWLVVKVACLVLVLRLASFICGVALWVNVWESQWKIPNSNSSVRSAVRLVRPPPRYWPKVGVTVAMSSLTLNISSV